MAVIALKRTVGDRVAIHTAGVADDLPGLLEQRDRPRLRIRNRTEILRRAQITGGRLLSRDGKG